MGCASSRVLGSELAKEKGNNGYAKGISMPTHPQQCPENFHIVALTSSTYGILKVETPKPPEEEGMTGQSVKEVLNKLNNMESKEDAGPQSWLEVSSMLENLKPGLEKAGKPAERLDSIDIQEIMMDIDEDTGLVKPKASLARRATLRKAGNSLPIYTLEELDKRIGGGKTNNTKQNQSPVATDFRSLLRPIGTANGKIGHTEEPLKNSPVKTDDEQKIAMATSPPVQRGGVNRKGSGLFDDDFQPFPTLSDDDLKVLKLQENVESELDRAAAGPTDACPMTSDTNPKDDQLCTSILAQSSQHNLTKETAFTEHEKFLSKVSSLSSQSSASEAEASSLESYEELCPPGGKRAVVLYTTSLRGIRKTYEECIRVREIVQSHGVLIDERDVSMHLEYRNELRELMQRLVTVPRLFINGRYIGGVEKVCKLQEGELASLFEGSTKTYCKQGGACDGCENARFVPCFECNGSRKVVDDKRQAMRCSHCNENGLVQCPICS